MRLRSVPTVTLFVLAVIAVYTTGHTRGGPIEPLGVLLRLAITGTAAAGFYAASAALRRFMQSRADGAPRAVVLGRKSGEGKFRVRGVDRASRMETTEFVRADSPDRARIQVDLKGVDVTTIERVAA